MESTNCACPEFRGSDTRDFSPNQTTRTLLPRTDVAETKDSIVLYLDMPGVEKSGLEISLDNRVLTISGNVAPSTNQSMAQIRREFEFGSYRRSFTLSDAIDLGGISASIKNGVVEVTLPKAAEVKPRKIEVKAV